MAVEDLEGLSKTAERALANKDWKSAAAALKALVHSHPEQVELRYSLARAYDELGQISDAIKILTHPSVVQRDKAKLRLAKIYIKANEHAAAKPLVDELVQAYPNNSKFLAWKSVCDKEVSIEGSFDRALKKANSLALSRRYKQAEQLYLSLLPSHPEDVRVYMQLGQLYVQQKRWGEAIPPFRTAHTIKPTDVKIKTSLARALAKEGKPAQAAAILRGVDVGLMDAESILLLQRSHMRIKNWTEAEQLGEQLLDMLPSGDARIQLAEDVMQDARVERAVTGVGWLTLWSHPEQALKSLKDIADQMPAAPLAWIKLGKALIEVGQMEDAIDALRTACRLRPHDQQTRKVLTHAIINARSDEDVLSYVQETIAAGAADFECHRWLATHYNKLYDWPAALHSARNALAINPTESSARRLAARALMRLSRLAEALEEVNLLPATGPRSEIGLQLKADILSRLSRVDEAIELYREALRKVPDHPLISHRLSYALLLKGDIAGFHELHERRRETKSFLANNKDYPFRKWNGEIPIDGKLLVWSEVGLGVGQNILHMTFLNSVTALGLDIVLKVELRLVDLCRRSFPNLTVVADDGELPAGISHHVPIASLSRWFKPDLLSFESLRPYFLADGDVVAAHRARLKSAAGEGKLLIGISWSSTNPFVGDEKSVPLDQLLAAISSPDVTLVNLQYGDHSRAIALAEASTGKQLMNSGIDNSNDLDGLAAVIAAMDLVVCIGHTTAHMAGAVGTPNFVLLPAAPFAHWLAEGEKCVWYPATTLFRRAPTDHGWEPVLDQLSHAVRNFADQYSPDSRLAAALQKKKDSSSRLEGVMSDREICDAVQSFATHGAYRSALLLFDRLPANHLTRKVMMDRAEMLDHIGRWDEALAQYVALRPPRGVDREVERRILFVCLAKYDLERALPIARLLAIEEPTYGMIAARILYYLRRHEEALSQLRVPLLEAAKIEGLSTLVGTILLELGELERAESYLAGQAAMNRRTDEYTLLGRCISAQGRPEEALVVLEKGLSLTSKKDPAGNFWRTQERIKVGLAKLAPLPPLQGEMPNVQRDDLVIYFAADSTYFWQHGLTLLASVGRHSPGAACHVHVINPDAGVAQAVEAVCRLLPGIKLSYSYEHVDFAGCTDTHVRTYYASVRFVRLAEIFAASPASYLCLDADSILRHDVVARGSWREVKDVGLRMRFDERPHMNVVASASIWRANEDAAKFIKRVRELIKSTLEAREAVWFLDQVVLSYVARELGLSDVAVSQLDMTYLDWFFDDDSLIWTGKGKRKSDDDRYTEEVAKYRYLQNHEELLGLIPEQVRELVSVSGNSA